MNQKGKEAYISQHHWRSESTNTVGLLNGKEEPVVNVVRKGHSKPTRAVPDGEHGSREWLWAA